MKLCSCIINQTHCAKLQTRYASLLLEGSNKLENMHLVTCSYSGLPATPQFPYIETCPACIDRFTCIQNLARFISAWSRSLLLSWQGSTQPVVLQTSFQPSCIAGLHAGHQPSWRMGSPFLGLDFAPGGELQGLQYVKAEAEGGGQLGLQLEERMLGLDHPPLAPSPVPLLDSMTSSSFF